MHSYMEWSSTPVVWFIKSTSSAAVSVAFIRCEKIGLFIECLMHATLFTLPLFSMAPTGHRSWHIKQSSGHPFLSLRGQTASSMRVEVRMPPSISRGPYFELKSNPFFPIVPMPTASAILTSERYPQKSPRPLTSYGNHPKTGTAVSPFSSMTRAACIRIASILR